MKLNSEILLQYKCISVCAIAVTLLLGLPYCIYVYPTFIHLILFKPRIPVIGTFRAFALA